MQRKKGRPTIFCGNSQHSYLLKQIYDIDPRCVEANFDLNKIPASKFCLKSAYFDVSTLQNFCTTNKKNQM